MLFALQIIFPQHYWNQDEESVSLCLLVRKDFQAAKLKSLSFLHKGFIIIIIIIIIIILLF